MSNFISIGPCWKFDLWPINFDLWGQIYPRSTVHWMFYQITYGGPACSSRCSDIAKYAHLTPFFQAPEMTLNELWPQIFVSPGNTGQWASICAYDINALYWTWQIWIFEDILTQTLLFDPCDPKWPQMKKWSNNICRVGQGNAHTWVTGPCCIILRTWCVFGKNDLFDLCDLGWPLTRSRVIWHMRGWVIDHCDQVSLKSIKATGRYIRLYGWQKKKKKKKKERTIEKQNTGALHAPV